MWDFFYCNLFLVDYDAPLSEAGDVTKKFWALSKIFKKYNPSSNHKGWSFLVLTHIRDQPLFIAWGVGGGFWGDCLIFRETKGGISCKLRTQRGESLKTLEGFRGGPLKFAWRMKTWGRGSRKSSNVVRMLLGGITSVK